MLRSWRSPVDSLKYSQWRTGLVSRDEKSWRGTSGDSTQDTGSHGRMTIRHTSHVLTMSRHYPKRAKGVLIASGCSAIASPSKSATELCHSRTLSPTFACALTSVSNQIWENGMLEE